MIPDARVGKPTSRPRLFDPRPARAALLCATAALLPVGYVLAGAVPLFVLWMWENAAARRWPWEPTPLDRMLFLWLALVGVSSVISPHRDLAVPNAVLLGLGPVAALAPTLRTLRERPGWVRNLFAAWVVGGVAAGSWVVWRYVHAAGGPGDLPQLGVNAAGTVLLASSLVGLGLCAAGGTTLPVLGVAAQVPILAGLLATFSRGSWMGWVGGLVCFTLLAGARSRRTRWLAAALAGAAVAVVVAYLPVQARALSTLDPGRNQDRLLLWRASLRMAAEHPWVGVGFGAFVREYPKYRLPQDPNTAPPFAHNLPLSLAAETGLLGLVAFAVFVGALLRYGWRSLQRAPPGELALQAGAAAALSGMLAQQLVDGTLQSFHLGLGFWLLAAVLLAGQPTSDRVRGIPCRAFPS